LLACADWAILTVIRAVLEGAVADSNPVKAQKLGVELARRLPEIRRVSWMLKELAEYEGDMQELLIYRQDRRKLADALGRIEGALTLLRQRASLENEAKVVNAVPQLVTQ
jgi:hypothetical protein